MITYIPTQIVRDDHKPKPIDPVVRRLAEAARISLPHAAVVAELAGLGQHARRATR